MSKEIIDHGFGVIETRETFYTEETMRQKDQKIADLEAKLAESESRFQAHKQTDARTIQCQEDLISELKQQLAEKTLTIEQINKAFMENRSLWKGKYEQSNQDKISFAIELLEKVKENIKKVPITDFDLSGNFEKMYKQDAIRQIDNQINELKGEMKLSRERLKTLLYNAIVLLEDCCGAVMNTDLELELGITQEEYDEIMG